MKITKTFVEKVELPPIKSDGKPGSMIYRDEALPGFGLRVYSGGTKAFIAEKRIKGHGRVRRVTLGKYPIMTTQKARTEALKTLGTMADGNDPTQQKKVEKIQQITLQEVFDDYLETHPKLTASTVADYRRALSEGFPTWVKKPITEISKDMVVRQHRKLSLVSQARADNTMRVLRALLNHAMAKYDNSEGNPIIVANPVNVLSQTRSWNPRKRKTRYIKPHQLAAWYQATLRLTFDTSRDYFHFLLFTGFRKSEAACMKWEDVDFIDQTFTTRDTKNSSDHTLPMSDFLYKLLKHRYDYRVNEWIFPSERSEDKHLVSLRSGMRRIVELSGVEFSFHDLRRTFITIAESMDISHYALKRLLNHKNSSDVTAGYIILDIERLREPMQRITDKILEFIERDPDKTVFQLNYTKNTTDKK